MANNVVQFAHLYKMLVILKKIDQQCWFVLNMFKNVGQHFGY